MPESLLTYAAEHLRSDCFTPSAEPWVNGAGDLYTKEFFKIVSSKLNDKGVFCQWLQLSAIDEKNFAECCSHTIHSAFPSTYVFHPHSSSEILIVSLKSQKLLKFNSSISRSKKFQRMQNWILCCLNICDVAKALSAKLEFCNIQNLPVCFQCSFFTTSVARMNGVVEKTGSGQNNV